MRLFRQLPFQLAPGCLHFLNFVLESLAEFKFLELDPLDFPFEVLLQLPIVGVLRVGLMGWLRGGLAGAASGIGGY